MSHPNKAHEELIEGLKIGPRILEDFVSGIPEAQLHRRRREGFWSLYEHVEHLAITQLILYKRLERFIKEERPAVPDGRTMAEQGRVFDRDVGLMDSIESEEREGNRVLPSRA